MEWQTSDCWQQRQAYTMSPCYPLTIHLSSQSFILFDSKDFTTIRQLCQSETPQLLDRGRWVWPGMWVHLGVCHSLNSAKHWLLAALTCRPLMLSRSRSAVQKELPRAAGVKSSCVRKQRQKRPVPPIYSQVLEVLQSVSLLHHRSHLNPHSSRA